MIARNKKKLEELQAALLSNNEKQILDAIGRLDEYPFPEIIEPLLVLYAKQEEGLVKAHLYDVLTSMKISGLEEIFFKALGAKEFVHCRKDLIHFMWSSNVQPVEGWVSIIELAANGTYEEIIEVMSLLDNTEHELPEEELLEAVSILKIAINENPDHETTAIKQVLLQDLNHRLNQ
jgi:hypothetical protein